MKTLYRILVAAVAAPILFASCQSKTEQPATQEVQLMLAPSVYGAFDAPGTRAVDLSKTGNTSYANYYYNGFKGEPAKTTLPIGSTVWLTYRKAKASVTNPDPANASHWEASNLQAYVVQNSAGYNALYPIRSHSITEDNVTYLEINDPVVYTTPLFLEEGKYQFRMVTPADRIIKSNLKMVVDNGMYVYASDERYEQTQSKVIDIVPTQLGVQNIILNPIIAQTARFKVTIVPGENVTSLEPMAQGVEISGLQNPELEEGGKLKFDWSSMSITDTLKMKKGDKHARAYIKEFERDASTGALTGAVGILPTNAMSTMGVVLINMTVNGIPTQYVVSLYQMKFFHGHSYDLTVQVKVDGSINVLNWANQAWSGEVTLN